MVVRDEDQGGCGSPGTPPFPGGVLSVTEVLPDPHYQAVVRVRQLAAEVGFHESQIIRGWLSFTMNLTKPAAV